MVIVKVMGGLGNQMFQYAFGKCIENRLHYKVKYDISYYENIPLGDTKRNVYITKLIGREDIATQDEIEAICNQDYKKINKVLKKIGLYKSRRRYEEPGEILDLQKIEDDMYLSGYWQSEKYFYEFKDLIRKEFCFAKQLEDSKAKEILKEIGKYKNTVSIHVRAGDYLTEVNKKTFGNICTSQYYIKAYYYVKNLYPEAKCFLFSNDVEWTVNNISLPYDEITIVSSQLSEAEEWIELYLMSMCTINVVANSSYSWWAAWLNENIDKVVICPTKWTNQKVSENVICGDWIRIDGEEKYE